MKFDELTPREQEIIKYARITREIRPDILDFAYAMEMTMRKHDPKKGDSYKSCAVDFLYHVLEDEYTEFRGEYGAFSIHEPICIKAARELVDVGNSAMMLWTRRDDPEFPKYP